MLNSEEEKAKKEGRPVRSKEEQDYIVSVAAAVGCLLGRQIAMQTEEYVRLKREQYRSEAEYLNAQNDLLEQAIADADEDIKTLQDDCALISKQTEAVRKLPVLRDSLKKQLTQIVDKRKKMVNDMESSLKMSKQDALESWRNTQDAETKAKLQLQINELDKRIKSANRVKTDLLTVSKKVSYV